MSKKGNTAALVIATVWLVAFLGLILATGITTVHHALVTETGPWVAFSLFFVGTAAIVQVTWGILSGVYKAGKESR